MEKMTKRDCFNALYDMVVNANVENGDTLMEFIEKELAQLDKRRDAAAKRAEKKKEASDALTEEIYGLLTDTPMTIDEIVLALDVEDVTTNKVAARLGKLIKADRVVKEAVRVDKRRKMAYRLAVEAEAETAEA
jgi:hypothetical protein